MRVGVGVGEEGLPWWLRWSKNLPAMRETRVQSLDGEDPLETGMATHSSILAWRIPRTEEPGGCSPWGPKGSDRTDKQAMGEERETEQENMRRGPKRNRKGGERERDRKDRVTEDREQ